MKNITIIIYIICLFPVLSKANEDKLAFDKQLNTVLASKCSPVLLENATSGNALDFIMFEMRTGFGAHAEDDVTGKLSRFLPRIVCSAPFSSRKVTLRGDKLTVRDVIEGICRQLHMKLIVDFENGFIFIPDAVHLDSTKYTNSGSIYILNDLNEEVNGRLRK